MTRWIDGWMVANKFEWHGFKKDARNWPNICVECQRTEIHRHTQAPLERFEVPKQHFDHVNIGLVDPLPPSQSYMHLLTMLDGTTRGRGCSSVTNNVG